MIVESWFTQLMNGSQFDLAISHDNNSIRALDLLGAFVKKIKQNQTICLLCLENAPSYWKRKLQEAQVSREKIVFLDFVSNSFEDLSDQAIVNGEECFSYLKLNALTCARNPRKLGKQCFIVIDGISTLFLTHGIGMVRKILHNLRFKPDEEEEVARSMICLTNNNIIEHEQASVLSSFANILHIDKFLRNDSIKCTVVSKNYKIRQIQEQVSVRISSKLSFENLTLIEENLGQAPHDEIEANVSMPKVPFNLDTSLEEKKARAHVRLEHEILREKVLSGIAQVPAIYGEQAHKHGASISYEPDANDDVDYEDPDDDLDL